MEHPGKICTRAEAVDYILRKLAGHTPSMKRTRVRETLEEQSDAWLLAAANHALDIAVERAQRRETRRAQRQRADR